MQQYMTNFISSLLLILSFRDYGILHITVSHQVAKIKAIFVIDFHLGLCCITGISYINFALMILILL